MKRIAAFFLILFCAEAQTISLPLLKRDWSFTAYEGASTKLGNNASGDLIFTFPQSCAVPQTCVDPSTVNYLQTSYTKSLAKEHYISVTMESAFTPGTQFIYSWNGDGNTCVYDAHARVIIEQRHDTGGQYMRWWSNPLAYDLTTGGIQTVTTPLTSDQWSSVYGQFGNSNAQAAAGFVRALSNVGLLGLTFGGGCFFGHGVDVLAGTATFNLISFEIK
jgi:hypothetical protein